MAIALAIAVSGCGTTTPRRDTGIDRPTVATPPSTRRGGGYYLDDGPGDNPPPDLESVPDAVPRAEPLHRGALRPYTVMGRSYTPMTALAPYRARGVASWYGRRYHGKPTSSGEPYDMYGMTAAHPVLPIPSYARVTHVGSGRSVVVRINDRGPFLNERIIDLSYTAAYKLGILAGGSALVDVETILPQSYATYAAAARAPATPAAPDPAEQMIVALSAAPEAADAAAVPAPGIEPAAAQAGGVFLQLGAFGSKENAESYFSRVKAQADGLAERLHVQLRDGYYRVQSGPYDSATHARAAAERFVQALGTRPVLVTR